jgi:hypothetical protein
MENASILGLLIVGLVAAFAFLRMVSRPKETTVPTPGPTPSPLPEFRPPIALPPFIVGSLDWRAQITLDFRYRSHGCDFSGAPLLVTGATDPDNQELEHFIEVKGPTKAGTSVKKYAVFGITTASSGKTVRVDGRWVRFPWVSNPGGRVENNAVTVCVIGNEKDDPGYPIVVKSCGPAPTPPPETGSPIGLMEVRYKVRNSSGQLASGLTREMIVAGGCS